MTVLRSGVGELVRMVLQHKLAVGRADLLLRGHPLQTIQTQHLVVVVLLHVGDRYLLGVLLILLVALLALFLFVYFFATLIIRNNPLRRRFSVLLPCHLQKVCAAARFIGRFLKESYGVNALPVTSTGNCKLCVRHDRLDSALQAVFDWEAAKNRGDL